MKEGQKEFMEEPNIRYETQRAKKQSDEELRASLLGICEILKERGYDPVRQIAGYLHSEDPTYFPEYRNARVLITEIDCEQLLSAMIRRYLEP